MAPSIGSQRLSLVTQRRIASTRTGSSAADTVDGRETRVLSGEAALVMTRDFAVINISSNRVAGLDIARGVAILGMFVLHAIPTGSTSRIASVSLDLAGEQRTQILFAVLDGIALGYLSSTSPSRGEARRRIAARGIFLVALGLLLSSLGSGIVVILDYYGIFFFLALPLLFVRTRFLVSGAFLLLVFGPLLSTLARNRIGDPSVPQMDFLPPLIDKAASWLLVGQYPAVVYMAYVALGLIVYRWRGVFFLHRRWMIAMSGGAFALLAVSRNLPSGTMQSTVQYASSAFMAVAITTVLVHVSRVPVMKNVALFPVRAVGYMPVTIYSMQVLFFGVLAILVPYSEVQSVTSFWALVFIAVGFSVLWLWRIGQGPLEVLNRYISVPKQLPHFRASRQDAPPVRR